DCPHTSRFTEENYGLHGPNSVTELKEQCEAKDLPTTGTKYDLTLRLVQLSSGIGDPRAPLIPSLKPILAEVQKVAYPPNKEMAQWPNFHHKYHLDRALLLVNALVESHVLDAKLIETGHFEVAWELVDGMNLIWGVPGDIRGWGYIHQSSSGEGFNANMLSMADRTLAYLQQHPEKHSVWRRQKDTLKAHIQKICDWLSMYSQDTLAMELEDSVLKHAVWGDTLAAPVAAE
ncbi:hypothetical protein KIPB_009539, partial [Kipferlia bialata]